MIDIISRAFETAITANIFTAFGLAFAGGILTGFSPCVLPLYPAVVGYVAKNSQDSRSGLRSSLVLSFLIAAGFALVFAIIGGFASYLGSLVPLTNRAWFLIVGFVFIIVGLHFMKVFRLNLALPVKASFKSLAPKGAMGAFIVGMLMGLAVSPCATPVVAIILTYAASKGDVLFGSTLLFAYSMGHGLPLMIAGLSTGLVVRVALINKHRQTIETISGLIFIALGLYFMWSA